jgi:CDP-Glycerol:Poly(glycerophosphate) glycerophosphotransferase
VTTADKRLWLVLPDPLPTRVFLECGIAEGLRDRLGDQLTVVPVLVAEELDPWADRLAGYRLEPADALTPRSAGALERVVRRADRLVDDAAGFYPLAIRTNLRHGFHAERMRPGHDNWFLDPERAGPLPRWAWLERAMFRWHFSPRRHVPGALMRRMREDCGALVVANLQTRSAVPYLTAARRLRIPLVGYISSWDHTVGKGAISPYAARYIVQNDVMRDDLARYHGIELGLIAVTGWPQTDVFYRRRPREAYDALLRGLKLDPARPLVLFMGNTPTNAPYEQHLVDRLVGWWIERGGPERFSLLLRPHPRDRRWQERFAAAFDRPGAYVQVPSYTDLETLATLLQHGDCVVANAGTILLDSLVNDRPAVCVLYDEGAPPGERWATLNAVGEHYRALMESEAFIRAERFEDVAAGIERSLERPGERAAERSQVAREVVGVVDGRAGERVVEAILGALPRYS